MPVDPNIRLMLDAMAGADPVELPDMTVPEARAVMAQLALVDGEPEPVADVTDRSIDGPGGPIPVRIYRDGPSGGAQPVLIWYHGGGWVIGDLSSADTTARKLARRTGAVVVSVDYRLAPEHPAPAAVEDCWTAFEWVAAHAGEIGGDPDRLAVGGDSAGGNLAAIVAVMARDAGRSQLLHQLLVYPATDLTASSASIDENGEGYLLTKKAMEWFMGHYLAGADPTDPSVSPMFVDDLSGVAPATVITAEFDPLRDEGQAYAARLTQAGVDCDCRNYDGMIHGFFALATVTPTTDEAIDAASARLRRSLV